MSDITEVSFRRDGPHSWRITHNGRILGDSPGYSRAAAATQAMAIVDADHAMARLEGRQPTKVLRPERPGWTPKQEVA
jgi:uncharacterized protein YegP (UPF0339 family)